MTAFSQVGVVCCYNAKAYPQQKICQDFDELIRCQSPDWEWVAPNVIASCSQLKQMNNSDFQSYCVESSSTSKINEEELVKPTAPKFVPPKLQIIIPGFGGFTVEESKLISEEDGRQYYKFPWIGEYFARLFRWGVWALSIVAVIMIMVAGFQWMTAMGNPNKIGKAKSKISDALFGLLLILGASLLLGFVNPNLTVFRPIVVGKIKKIELNDWTEDVSVTNTNCPDPDTLQDISDIDNVVFNSQYSQPRLLPATAEKLILAAAALKNEGIVLQVNNAFRTFDQQQLLYNNRGKNPSCEPRPNECNCPHMLGVGVDVVCKGKNANDPCQEKIKKAMLEAGFCQLSKEAWHFEYPKISKSCQR